MTIESKSYIVQLLKSDGIDEDFQYSSVWSYNSVDDKPMFAVFISERDNDIMISPYVRNPECLWNRFEGVTPEGVVFLAQVEQEGGENSAT